MASLDESENDLRSSVASVAYKPRLKIFLSADIVGSTALKQSYKDDISDVVWPDIIQGFYRNFIESIAAGWLTAQINFQQSGLEASKTERAIEREQKEVFGPAPKFWKTIGDEVLFWKEITHEEQVASILAVWLRAVHEVRDFFHRFDEPEVSGLDIKSTCWIAGFPVRNRMFTVLGNDLSEKSELLDRLYKAEEIDPQLSYDFVGPAFDIGFRLTNFSTDKKMHLDVATAYLLCIAFDALNGIQLALLNDIVPAEIGYASRKPDGHRTLDERLNIFYSGSEVLKGVGGVKYPKLWINTAKAGTSESIKEGLIYPDGRPCVDKEALAKYCEQLYSEREKSISKPFVIGEGTKTYINKPKNYDAVRSRMEEEFLDRTIS